MDLLFYQSKERPHTGFAGCYIIPEGETPGDALILLWTSMGAGTHPGDAYDIGTCFMVSASALVTANHCLDHVKRELSLREPRYPDEELRVGFRAVEWESAIPIGIKVVGSVADVDGAYLYVDATEPRRTPLPPPAILRTTELCVGERLRFYGFPDVETVLDADASAALGRPVVGVRATAVFGEGTVSAEPPDERGVFVNLQKVDGVEAPPGLSGAPVYDEFERCVGFVSSSMQGSGYTRISTWQRMFRIKNVEKLAGFEGTVVIADQEGEEFSIEVDNRDLPNPRVNPLDLPSPGQGSVEARK
jgi:hypothetical protein